MPSLHENGWRQGAILRSALPSLTLGLDAGGALAEASSRHGVWVVASQDCDLDLAQEDSVDRFIELRPVYTERPPTDWGVRSSRFLLTDGMYTVSDSPRAMVTAALLSSVGSPTMLLPSGRSLAFKKWLGLRYDRPAVPERLVGLAKEVAKCVASAARPSAVAEKVRDVLMQFDESVDPPKYSLFAIVDDDDGQRSPNLDEVRDWLAEIALKVPLDLGVADELEAATPSGVSLRLIETSYAAEISQITWKRDGPEGAH